MLDQIRPHSLAKNHPELVKDSANNGTCDTQNSYGAKRLEVAAGIEMLNRGDPGSQSVVEGDREGAPFATDDCRRKAKIRELELNVFP